DGVEIRLLAAKRGVERLQLSALTHPPHPDVFLRVPPACAVEQKEVGMALIFGVEGLDPFPCSQKKGVVSLHGFSGGVAIVAKQCKGQVGISIAEEAHLERPQKAVDLRGVGEHGRNSDDTLVGGR